MACRLCLRIFENDSEYSQMAQHQDQEFLVNFLFEVLDMEITSDPLICTDCKLFTEKIHKFLEDCLNAQNRLYDYIRERGLNKLSNDDLVHIAKEQEAVKTSSSPDSDTNLNSTNTDGITEVADGHVYVNVPVEEVNSCDQISDDIIKNSDPNLFQYVLAVAPDGTVSEVARVSDPCLGKTSDMDIEMVQYDTDTDITETCTSEENEIEHLDSDILGPKLGYPDSEILTDIVVYDQHETKSLDFNHSAQSLLRDNPTIGALDADYNKSDPKIFECPTDLEVLELQTKADMFDVDHNSAEIFNEILDYDHMGTEILGYHEDIDKIGPAGDLHELDGLDQNAENGTAPNGVKSSFESCVCDQCGMPFKNKRGLMSHVIQKHNKVDAQKCSLCGYDAKNKSLLEKHMKFHHNDTANVKMHQCPNCTYKTPRKDTLHYHIKFVHSKKSELEVFKCDLCDYQTVRKQNLTSHMKYKHSQAGELEVLHCSYCQYQTVRKKYLQYHMKYQHSQQGKLKTHFCPNCDFKTFKEDSLAQHLEQEHPNGNNLKLHKCTICGYQTIRKASLKLHIKCRHRKKEECEILKCKYCTFQTHRKDTFRKHIKFMHDPEGDLEVYQCYFCHYQTVRKEDFHRHIRLKHKDEDL